MRRHADMEDIWARVWHGTAIKRGMNLYFANSSEGEWDFILLMYV